MGNVSSTSVNHVAAIKKPPPCKYPESPPARCVSVLVGQADVLGVKTPRRRGKKLVIVEEGLGKSAPGTAATLGTVENGNGHS